MTVQPAVGRIPALDVLPTDVGDGDTGGWLQPRRGNAERDNCDNAVQALSAPISRCARCSSTRHPAAGADYNHAGSGARYAACARVYAVHSYGG